ncbi:hypothetical protein CR513_34558, partial [Mucuna pruriens]
MASKRNVVFVVPLFCQKIYQIQVVKMRSCLKSFGLWEYHYKDKTTKSEKVVSCLHSTLVYDVFTSIMYLETAKKILDELK